MTRRLLAASLALSAGALAVPATSGATTTLLRSSGLEVDLSFDENFLPAPSTATFGVTGFNVSGNGGTISFSLLDPVGAANGHSPLWDPTIGRPTGTSSFSDTTYSSTYTLSVRGNQLTSLQLSADGDHRLFGSDGAATQLLALTANGVTTYSLAHPETRSGLEELNTATPSPIGSPVQRVTGGFAVRQSAFAANFAPSSFDNGLPGTPITLSFTLAQPVMAPVPEPAEWAMLVAGLGLVGAVARRRARR